MSILDLHADEQVQASLNTAPATVAPPAKFSAWSAIPRGIAVAAGEVGASAADLVNAARVFRDTPSREIAASGLPTSAFSSELGDTVRSYWNDFKPDPNTATTAEQVLFGFSRGLAKVVPATIAAGPVGAIVAGIEEGMTVSDELRRKGVGADARTKAGMIQGAGLASAALPLLGTTLAETAALYVAGGPGGFMAQQALTRQILRDAGHDQIAAGYDPFDPVGLAVASLIPAGFTAYGLRGQVKAARAKAAADFNAGPVPSEPTPVAAAVADAYKPAPPSIPPEVVDAAMVQNTRDFAASQVPVAVAHAEAWRGPVTDNPNFKAWFGDSKVVGEDGAPMVVYHGTRGNVGAFDTGRVKERFPHSEGLYFISNPKAASVYADSVQNAAENFNPASKFGRPVEEGANVVPAYVSLNNPKIIETRGLVESIVDGDNGAMVRQAKADGFDGVIVRRRNGDEFDTDLVIAFRPEQIKSAIGNSGRFDPNSASLTDPVPRAAATEAAPPKPAAEAGDPIAKLNEPADAKPKPAVDPIMSTVAMRVADLESTAPDMVVRIAEDGKAVTLADDLAEVRRMVAEGTDDSLGTLDADLMRVAVECALSTGG